MVQYNPQNSRSPKRSAFSLLELMVVIAIIALLVAILLPSLQSARNHAKTTVCGTNLASVGKAMANYLFSSESVYPVSYAYPIDKEGNWSPGNQSEAKEFGYVHWSHFMYDDGQVDDKSFQCPTMDHGGAPRTFPGPELANWEDEQVAPGGQRGTAEPMDKQAPRMSYTANAVIMPRNKFNITMSGGQRVNRFVRENQIKHPGRTILATEFLDNWKAVGIRGSDGVESRSHRPINPFYHQGGGWNEYATPPTNPGFVYGPPGQPDKTLYGLQTLENVRDATNLLDHTSGGAQINAVGRHHPTAKSIYRKKYGGSANFLFSDTHVENMTVLDSMDQRKWGDAYYSLEGQNKVLNMGQGGSGQ